MAQRLAPDDTGTCRGYHYSFAPSLVNKFRHTTFALLRCVSRTVTPFSSIFNQGTMQKTVEGRRKLLHILMQVD